MSRVTPRLYGVLSLLLLGAYAAGLLLSSGTEPFPLGGPSRESGAALRAGALAMGLTLGWGVPGLSLALLADPRLRGAALLARALGLGVGYVLATGLGYAAVMGHAPQRGALLVLLALPPVVGLVRDRRPPAEDAPPADATVLVAVALMALVTAGLWGKLARDGLNGDGTEAYELARSLEAHALPRWDLERWEGPGRFGTPLVNPFVTNSYLVNAEMALLGRGELAARLPFVPAVILAGLLAGAAAGRPGLSGASYVAAVTALAILWNACYVGYEPAFTDLAEPAATDLLMTALFMAGFVQAAGGAVVAGVATLVLSAGVLYSSPLLTLAALGALATSREGRRPLALWLFAVLALVPLVLAVGTATGDLGDWIRQVKSEYWSDLVDHSRRTPSLPVLGQILLATGGLPLAALASRSRLSAANRALLTAGLVYAAVVLASSYKNLHYLAPLPFLLAGPAVAAAGPRLRAAAAVVVLAALALSWPGALPVSRETVELGRASCVAGLTYEEAALAADVVYEAFARPGRGGRFAVGKHTFVRYAMDLGDEGRCVFRLGRDVPDGWTPVARGAATLAVRDPATHALWRDRELQVPRSWLFPGTR